MCQYYPGIFDKMRKYQKRKGKIYHKKGQEPQALFFDKASPVKEKPQQGN